MLQEIAERMNHDLSKLPVWLRANKLSLTIENTELVVLWKQNTKLNNSFQIKLDQKRLFPINSMKYLGLLLDEHSIWPLQISHIQMKLNRAIGILSKLWYQANIHILKTVYHSFLGTHLLYKAGYGVQTQAQNQFQALQNRALKIIVFKNWCKSADPLYKELKILKFHYTLRLKNCLFMCQLEQSKN